VEVTDMLWQECVEVTDMLWQENINNFIYHCHKFAVQDTADRSMGMPSLSILIKIMDGCMGTRLHGNKATTKTAEGEGG